MPVSSKYSKIAAAQQAEKTKTAAGEGDGVRYNLKNTTDKNVVSIKQQSENVAQELNAADPVARKTVFNIFGSMNIKQKRAWAEAEALKYGNRVDRQEYGSIEVSRKDVNSALNYLQSDGEIAAFAALPHVLKRGKEIYREADHKGRGYSTVTFAGLVEINDTRGNMAVVVRETSKNHYDMHRIVMPDGSAFTFAEKTNAETGSTAATSSKDALTQPTASTSKVSIPADGENVKRQFSLKASVDETKNLLALHNLTEKNLLGRQRTPNFNPRPPRGGRLFRPSVTSAVNAFQSTPPARGATGAGFLCPTYWFYFNPRPPRGGATFRCSAVMLSSRHFNPRPPRGGRHIATIETIRAATISIHAPREGGDSKDAQFYLRIFDKQVELLRFLGKIRGWLPEKPGKRPAFSREKPCEPPGNLWSLGLRGGREGASRIPVRRTTAAPGGVCQRIRGSSGR